jgi:flagellar FliJ protein
MGYHFPLASVLRLRELAEEREERLLQSIHGEIARAWERLNRKNVEMKAICASRDANASAGVLAAELHSMYAELDTLAGSRNQLMQHIGQLEELKDRQVTAYQKALQDREALGQIRDQRQTEHDAQIAKLERRNVDDAFGAKLARRRRSR